MAGVEACCVGMPDVDEDVGKRFACFNVDHADVQKLIRDRRERMCEWIIIVYSCQFSSINVQIGGDG